MSLKSNSFIALTAAVNSISHIDDYDKVKIGAGFFSDVFKVTNKSTGRVSCLKLNNLLSNRCNVIRELQLMNGLRHPNILRYEGACVVEGTLHALTEFLEGGNLEQLIGSEWLEWKTRIELCLDISIGMTYLHNLNLIHRDLTSKNVLIRKGPQYRAIIADFGLAARCPEEKNERLGSAGSPYWMSPECLKGEWYDQGTDVFSYGILSCEVIARISADPDFLPRSEDFGLDKEAFLNLVEDCPASFLHITFDCCQVAPVKRPKFRDIRDRLQNLLKLREFSKSTDSFSSPRSKKKGHRRSSSEEALKAWKAPSERARLHEVRVNPFRHLNLKSKIIDSFTSCTELESGFFSPGPDFECEGGDEEPMTLSKVQLLKLDLASKEKLSAKKVNNLFLISSNVSVKNTRDRFDKKNPPG